MKLFYAVFTVELAVSKLEYSWLYIENNIKQLYILISDGGHANLSAQWTGSASRQSWCKNDALFLALLVFIVERETHAHTHTNTQRDIHKTIILLLESTRCPVTFSGAVKKHNLLERELLVTLFLIN